MKKYKLLGILVLILIAIQLVPYGKDHSNPAVVVEPAWDTPKTRELFFRACADCHSHETKWPWYSHIAPVSWLVASDVDEGREHFNVSMWGIQAKNEGEEAAKAFREEEMQPWFYKIPHPEAKLSEQEAGQFLQGLVATFGEDQEDNEHH